MMFCIVSATWSFYGRTKSADVGVVAALCCSAGFYICFILLDVACLLVRRMG